MIPTLVRTGGGTQRMTSTKLCRISLLKSKPINQSGLEIVKQKVVDKVTFDSSRQHTEIRLREIA